MRHRWIVCMTALGLLACSSEDSLSPSTPEQVGLTSSSPSHVLGEGSRGIEDEILAIDQATGILGGMSVDRKGDLVLWVTEPGKAATVTDALERRANNSSRERNRLLRRPDGSPRNVHLRNASFRFSELVRFQKHTVALMRGVGGVYFADANEGSNRVTVGVRDSSMIPRLESRLRASNVPTAAFEYSIVSGFGSSGSIRDKFRPTGAGMQILVRFDEFYPYYGGDDDGWGVCTLGFNVTDSVGTRYALSAGHCLPNRDLGLLVSNPTNGSSTRWIGHTVDINEVYSCQGTSACVLGDVLLIEYLPDVLSPPRIIHTSSSGGSYSAGTLNRASGDVWDTVDSAYTPRLNDVLHKVGRTTGWTDGYTVGTCETWYDPNDDTYYECQGRFLAVNDSGDSGAPVFYHDTSLPSNVRVPAGILHGYVRLLEPPGVYVTYTRFTPRHRIADEFGTLHY